MDLNALLRVFYFDVYEFEVYDPFSRPQTRILRGIAVKQFEVVTQLYTLQYLHILHGGKKREKPSHKLGDVL